MSMILLMLASIIACCFIMLIFAMFSAGRRADEGEEKLLGIISSPTIATAELETSLGALEHTSAVSD